MIATFDQSKYRFQIYVNSKKKTWQQIKAETGCYALCNLGYYNMATFKASAGLIVDGEVIAAPIYHQWGLCIDADGKASCNTEDSAAGKVNYCIAQPPMVINGKTAANAKFYSKNGTTMIGFKADGSLVVLMAGKSDGMTSTEAVKALKNEGCIHILRYDGSWSTQGSLGDGMDLQPDQKRIVHNYLLIYDKTQEGSKPMFKLALGAGHGIHTEGKRCLKALDPNETREWWLNDRICDYIESYLKDYEGYTLIRLDDSDDGEVNVPLATRVTNANNWGADFYLSIHHNAGINGGSGGGIVAYSYPGAKGKTVEWRDALYDSLIKYTGLKGNRSNPKAEANFYVLKYTKMAATLLELGFMDSKTDVPVILSDDYAQKCAKAIVEVIVQRGGLTKKQTTEENALYKVQLGAFSKKENAEALSEQLKASGYQTYIVKV